MVLTEKFLRNGSFNFDDFSVQLRDKLLAFDEKTDENELSIQMILDIVILLIRILRSPSKTNLCNVDTHH